MLQAVAHAQVSTGPSRRAQTHQDYRCALTCVWTTVGCGQMGSTLMGPLKSHYFDRLEKKVRSGTFGKIQVGSREYPKSPSVKKHLNCSDPISADLICPFPSVCEMPR